MAGCARAAPKRTVAALDANPGNLAALERVIRDAGYGFCGARTPADLLLALKRESPGLVLVDLDGLASDDLEFLSVIQKHTIPFIVVSSSPHPTAPGVLSVGPDAIFTKPLALKKFLSLVAALLDTEGAEE